MALSKKWVVAKGPDEPLVVVARRALRERLTVVWHWLRLAAEHADEDVEYVHQLRVAVRRAVAAIDMFADLLPPKKQKRLRKRLGRIRRAAGRARDLDVLLLRNESVDLVERRLRAGRREAQSPIGQEYERLLEWEYPRRVAELVERVRWRWEDDEPTYGAAARQALRPAVDRFFAVAAALPVDVATLHRLRIAGKQLRYSLEIFAAGLPSAARERAYPIVAEVQEHLGEINDRAVAQRRFGDWAKEERPGSDDATVWAAAAQREAQALATAVDDYQQWWTHDRAGELRGALTAALAVNGNGHES